MKQTAELNRWVATDKNGTCFLYDAKPVRLKNNEIFVISRDGNSSINVKNFIENFSAPAPMAEPQQCVLTFTIETVSDAAQSDIEKKLEASNRLHAQALADNGRLMQEIKELKERCANFEKELHKPIDFISTVTKSIPKVGQKVRLITSPKTTTIKKIVNLNERNYYVLKGYNGRYKRESFIVIK